MVCTGEAAVRKAVRCVLVCLSGYNSTSQTAELINSRNLIPTVLEASKVKVPTRSLRALFHSLLAVSSCGGRARELPGAFIIEN